MNKAKVEAIIATYLRAAAASVIALYLAGVTEPKALFSAGLAAIAGPVLKALDPKAKDFGKQAK
jgi:predicted phage tail protein